MESNPILLALLRSALSSVVAGSIILLILRWHQQQMRQKAGRLLLPLPLTRSRLLLLLGTVTIALIAVALLFHFVFSTSLEAVLTSIMSGVMVSVVFTAAGAYSAEIHDRGILVNLVLLQWSQVKSYQWTGNNHHILLFNLNQPLDLSISRQVRIWIDSARKSDVESILQQKLH